MGIQLLSLPGWAYFEFKYVILRLGKVLVMRC